MKIGFIWEEDREYFDEWAYKDFESWDNYKKQMCHSALVVPYPNIDVRFHLDPSEAILCFYSYPCEKENPQTDFVTFNKVLMSDDIHEIFEID